MGRRTVFPGTMRPPLVVRTGLLAAGLFTMVWPAWDIVTHPRDGLLAAGFSWLWVLLIFCFTAFGAVIAAFGFAFVRAGPGGLRYQNSLLSPAADIAYEQIRTVETELFGVLLVLKDGRRQLLFAGARDALPTLFGRPTRADQLVEFVQRQVRGHW